MKPLFDLGVLPIRHRTGKGFKPHVCLTFNAGKRLTFAVDTTNLSAVQPDAYLITHAHSDHYGKSVMMSERAICSEETAHALEILYKKKYAGRTFRIGETIDICGVGVKTYHTHHTIGSSAFFWENEVGTKILVTGDVKEAMNLPVCDCLVTEANYGDPDDSKCHFKDDINAFREAVESSSDDLAFGAYAFGKAQRAVKLLRESGYSGVIGMDDNSLALTSGLMENTGHLVDLSSNCGIKITTPAEIPTISASKKFILTGRHDYKIPTINISDHMDVNGLISMTQKCAPEAVIVYHPGGHRPFKLAAYLNKTGIYARALEQISTCIDI
ncbi:MAG: MBL fold metallo-hydrolase [Candidatus Methanoperedens sp.]|nr:MBL fold metallo-hydrolase [Candidatus Methanoperedens sp.]MCE8426683.1 MBL fold metallo-hydrolase [Candidatus Methanoperedens sp.]MCE8429685.1 MBL fold metallo-hydrolase [Candidatus Methanoperedens sp.]